MANRVPLTSASYNAQSLIANAQRCINLYPEVNKADSPVPMTFYRTPGLRLWSTIPGTGPVRGLFRASNGALFGVRGADLCLYQPEDSTWRKLAALGTDKGPVVATDNSVTAVFVDGTAAAPTVTLADNTAGLMSGDGWYGADFVRYLDSYLVFNKPNTQQFYITGQLDLTLDALDFASAEATPDKLISLLVDHRELWLFGETTTEVWGDSGDALFPFSRINGTIIQVGCSAKHTPVRIDNSLIWIGSDGEGDVMVWRARGYDPARISTHALESEMASYSRIDDAFAYTYQQKGHAFYVLTFPTAGKTWCYDPSTNEWHERAYRTANNVLTRHRSSCHVFYDRKNLVGDFENGNVYVLDPDVTTDNGDDMLWLKSFQHLTGNGVKQFFGRFTLDAEVGTGSVAGDDPIVSLRWSDDGGRTWSSPITDTFGALGQTKKRVNFSRLGSGYDRVFEVSGTSAARVALQGAFIGAAPGTA
jgi:hypothetical protein